MKLFSIDEERLAQAAEGGTPCFVYDLDVARSRFGKLRAALPARVELAYAVKANPGLPLLRCFAELGAGFDCASAGELALVAEARAGREAAASASSPGLSGGRVPGRIVFAGPAKSQGDLKAALAAGARIQVDGVEDLERLDALLTDRTEAHPVNVRVHPQGDISEANRIIGGAGPSAFGVDEESLDDFINAAVRYPRVRLAGLQVFAASNERSAQALLSNHATALRIGRHLQEALGYELDLIDLGGGLGIPYAEDEEEFDLKALGGGLNELLADNPWFTGRLFLEPGRWLAGPCGTYLCRVVRLKESRGVAFALLEGGINHLLRPLLTGQPFPAKALGKKEAAPKRRYALAGPLCTSLDRLGELELPELSTGDLVAFGQAGAYGRTEAMVEFLSREPARELWLSRGGL